MSAVRPNSDAERSGLRLYDQLVEVDCFDLTATKVSSEFVNTLLIEPEIAKYFKRSSDEAATDSASSSSATAAASSVGVDDAGVSVKVLRRSPVVLQVKEPLTLCVSFNSAFISSSSTAWCVYLIFHSKYRFPFR